MEKLARRTRVQNVTNHNTPRSIRARLAHPRRRPVQEAPALDVPNQQVARSSSGKMALGPWIGSFGGMDEMGSLLDAEPSSPTIFATSQGRVFADLIGSPVAVAELLVSGTEVVAAAPQHPEDSRTGRQAQLLEASVLRRKAEAHRSRGPEGRGPRVNRQMRRYRMIGQARKAN